MDIRKAFLDYFASKNHQIIQSSPLVPDDDSLLFTNAGMVQFKPIFTGEVPIPSNPRATTSQTCIRAGGKHNDLDNVGYTARHHTFFEMLGNFSFGDYFKEEAISFAWEFVTKVVGLEPEKLWITVHDSDDEAEEIWQKYVPKEKIVRMGDKDNFWQMGDSGPCGPCSEIHYDQGEENFSSSEDYLGGEGDRFLEIWNLVFMQYNKKDGVLEPLPKPSIDTGMGLERIVAIKEGKFSNFDTSLFMPIIKKIEEISRLKYEYESGASFRVIADHIRSVSFLLAQGTNFDKEGRGYVLRRILRRAVRHGYLLGLRRPFMHELVDVVADLMQDAYSYLQEKKQMIKDAIRLEEERFFSTISAGMELFNKELEKNLPIFSGDVAFMLYDTYGFPLDLTLDMLRDKNIDLDINAYEKNMQEQKSRARASWKNTKQEYKDSAIKSLMERFGENVFCGYDSLFASTKVLAILGENEEELSLAKAGQTVDILLEKTPFYPLGGGQVADLGEIINKGKVLSTQKVHSLIFSTILLENELKVGEIVECKVDEKRLQTAKHHSATHLLHLALTSILGDHLQQAGSYCDNLKLRFDFNHPKALTKDELDKIEAFVNAKIQAGLKNSSQVLPIDDAKKLGAKALFSEKYGEMVRVVDFGGQSIEFCGGTHVENTAQIGSFFIVKESSVSSGIRRIEAVVGESAYLYAKKFISQTNEALVELKALDLSQAIKKLQAQNAQLKQELKQEQKSLDINSFLVGDVNVVIDKAKDPKQALDLAKQRFEKTAVMIFGDLGDKLSLVAGSKNSCVKANIWLKDVCEKLGGKGGGKEDFASGSIPKTDIQKSINLAKESLSKLFEI